MTRVRIAAWHATIFSALGLGPVTGCGGVSTSSEPSGEGGSGNAGSSGASEALPGGTGSAPAAGRGGSGAGPGVGGTGGAGGRNVDFQRCVSPTPYVITGEAEGGFGGEPSGNETGFIQCADGWVHRDQIRECPSFLPRADFVTDVAGECTKDADCTNQPEGRCLVLSGGFPGCGPGPIMPASMCFYGCTRDEHCGEGFVCLCGEPTGRCVPATCATDADCDGLLCASNGAPEGTSRFACQTPRDTCMTGADCPGANCVSAEERTCVVPMTGTGGSCGRPFLVAGSARLAAVCDVEGGWARRAHVDSTRLSERARRALASHWTEIGRMEHASVAAFARFTLELLSLGAPAELVAGAQRAMGDEIEHARLCFGLAAAYAKRPVGPAALSIEGALDARSFEAIVRTAMLEACVGETLAAIEAEGALAVALDPDVRRVLERIASDEARHAELGFRFLGWALERAAPGVRARLVAELGAALASVVDESIGLDADDDAELASHGMLPSTRQRAVRRIAVREVIEPVLRGLEAGALRHAA